MIDNRATALLAFVLMPALLVRGFFAFLSRDIRLARKALTFYETMWAVPRVLFWGILVDVLQIKGVLVANDHSPNFVTLVRAARIMGVPSFYVQHAHVTKKFPPLATDYAFLDGELAAICYDYKPSKFTKVLLTGSPRLSPLVGLRQQQRQALGIGLSLGDSVDNLRHLVDSAVEAGFRVVVRTHPATSAREIDKLLRWTEGHPLLTLSEGHIEKVENFLSRIHVLIAGDTSLHLEAFLAGCFTFYYKLRADLRADYYGFCESGICLELTSEEQLTEALNGFSRAPLMAGSKVCASLGTTFEKHPERVIVDVIRNSLNGREPNGWVRDTRFQNEVYSRAGNL
ncbi:MAG: hypothetical protein WC314_18190 [Vulcanimicrobiota bacterium]